MARTKASPTQRRRGRQLANQLKKARKASGRSREDVARGAGVSLETIKHIEEGRALSPTFFTVTDIARELQVRLNQLDKATK